MAEIREAEWLAELERLSTKNDKGWTTAELSDALGRSQNRVREMLALGIKRGTVTVGYRTMTRIDGRPNTAPVYLIRSPKEASTTTTSGASPRAKRRGAR